MMTCKHYDVYELAMEIINLPTKCFRLLQRFRNMLIENIDENNHRLLDIIEVLSILYPVTTCSFSDKILGKLKGKQYYRFYWRLRPKHPPKPVDFEVNDIVTMKWMLLSFATKLEKFCYAADTSKEDVNSLIANF